MKQLEKMLDQFISNEKMINNAAKEENDLSEKYQNLLKENKSFSVEDAEKVYSAYDAIENHKNKVEDAKRKLSEASCVIKQYLDAIGNKSISYSQQNGSQSLTYSFELSKNGEVIHNHQNTKQ